MKAKRTVTAALSGAAFFYALGIVGAVEQGANVSRLLWTIPLLFIGFVFAIISQNA